MPSRSPTDAAELLKLVVDNAPIVVFALDADGIFTLSQGRGLDALGLKPGEVNGRSVFAMYKDYPRIVDACRRALKGETVTSVVPVHGLAFETRYTPLLDWGGKVTGALGVSTDVTAAYNAALAKDEFLSVISHELRTPLTSALGWAWMLKEGELEPAEKDKALATVCRNLEELKRLVAEIRVASDAATGRLTLKRKPCDLAEAVRQAARSLAPAADAKRLTLEIAAPSLRGAADKARVRQITWILLSNAVKHSPAGSSVGVRLGRAGDEAVLTVTDSGPGLPPSLRSQIFDLARRPDEDHPPRARGLGLGLAVARRLTELHGGSIAFEDREGGAAFTVRLPLR